MIGHNKVFKFLLILFTLWIIASCGCRDDGDSRYFGLSGTEKAYFGDQAGNIATFIDLKGDSFTAEYGDPSFREFDWDSSDDEHCSSTITESMLVICSFQEIELDLFLNIGKLIEIGTEIDVWDRNASYRPISCAVIEQDINEIESDYFIRGKNFKNSILLQPCYGDVRLDSIIYNKERGICYIKFLDKVDYLILQ